MQKYLNHKKIFLVAALLVVAGLSSVYLFQRGQPDKNRPLVAPSIPASDYPEVSLEFTFPPQLSLNIPNTLAIYAIDNYALTATQISALASIFDLSGQPRLVQDPIQGDTYLWINDPKTLSIKKGLLEVSFSDTTTLATSASLTQSQLQTVVQDLINQINDQLKTNLAIVNVSPYKAYTDEIEILPLNIDYYQFDLASMIDGLPVITPLGKGVVSQIIASQHGSIYRANLILPPAYSSTQPLVTLTIEELKAKITEAEMVDFQNPEAETNSFEDFFAGSVVVDEVSLAYYQYPKQKVLQPVFVIQTSGTTKGGVQATGTFVLSAVK